jgi:hypothetical protein
LSSAENSCLAQLVIDLNRTGYAQGCDLQAVLLAARRMARVQEMAALVSSLPSLTVTGGNGQEMLHPFLNERRAAERDLADSLRVLNLTPGARKSVRTGGREVKQAIETDDPQKDKILKLLG